MRRVALGLAIGVAGCTDPVSVIPWSAPPPAPGASSVILVVSSDPPPSDEGRGLYAIPIEAFAESPFLLEFDRRPSLRVVALQLAETLPSLDLEPGPIPEAPSRGWRPPPDPLATHERSLDSTSDGVWAAAEAPGDLRLPPIDWPRCLGAGGCAEDVGTGRCKLPCNPPEPERPRPPDPPTLSPLLADPGSCAPPWSGPLPWGESSLRVCEPQVPDQVCPPGEVQAPDRGACDRLGPACPPGPFRDLPLGAINPRWVDGAAPAGGDGTLARPFRRVGDALQGTWTELTVVLAKGTYAESLDLDRRVTLWGACAAETIIDARGLGPGIVSRGRLALEGLTVKGDDRIIEVIGTLEARGAVLEDGAGFGLQVQGAAFAHLDDVVIRRTGNAAVSVIGDGRITLNNVLLEDATAAGVVLHGGGASMTATDLVVRRIQADANGDNGHGIFANQTSRIDLEGALVERATTLGVSIRGSRGVSLSNLVVRDVRGTARLAGAGLELLGVDSATISQVLVLRPADRGFQLGPACPRTVLTDLRIVDVAARQSDGCGGEGVVIGAGSFLHGSRIEVDGASADGLWLDGGRAHLEDVTIRDIVGSACFGQSGEGLSISSASVAVTRIAIEDIQGAGVLSEGMNASGRLDDLAVRRAGSHGVVTNGIDDELYFARALLDDTAGHSFLLTIDTGIHGTDVSAYRSSAGLVQELSAVLSRAGSRLHFTRFLLEDHPLALRIETSLQGEFEATFTDGWIRNNDDGILFQGDPPILPQIVPGVRFSGNGRVFGGAE